MHTFVFVYNSRFTTLETCLTGCSIYKSWKRKELQIANLVINNFSCFVSGFFKKGYRPSLPVRPTGVALDSLKHIGNVFSAVPGGDFKVHGGK